MSDWMSRRAVELHREGRDTADIAALFGVTNADVRKWVRPSRSTPKPATASGEVCETCGTPHGIVMCGTCRGDERTARLRYVRDRWVGGATYGEIASELGTTWGAIAYYMRWMRANGWDVPLFFDRDRALLEQAA